MPVPEDEPVPVALDEPVPVALLEPVWLLEAVTLDDGDPVGLIVAVMVSDIVALIVAVIEREIPQLSSRCTCTEAKEPPSSGTVWNPQ